MTSDNDPPPAYRPRLSALPGYFDDKPSISLTGVFPSSSADIATPARGRGVSVLELRNLDARRRFGQFGSTFVERERVRQARAIEKSQSMMELRETETKERPKISERCRVARGVAKMYNSLT